jgi:hypothetical protein
VRRDKIEIDESKLTLQDLIVAIRIIEIFTERIERARSVLYRLARALSGSGGSERDLYQILISEALRQSGLIRQGTVEEPERLSEEELKKIRELIKKE